MLSALSLTFVTMISTPTKAPNPPLLANLRDSVEYSASTASAPSSEARKDSESKPWIKRYLPKKNRLHLGAFGGVFIPSESIELFKPDPGIVGQGHKPFRTLNGEVGARLSYKILRALAVELEGVLSPGKTEPGESALFWGAKSHILAQIPRWRISPFALVGAGLLGVASHQGAVGNDTDFAVHAGVGFDIGLKEHLRMRLDVRDIITASKGVKEGFTQNLEANLGLALAFDLSKQEAPPEPVAPLPRDSDRDGFVDSEDKCVQVPGVAPDGCPAPAPEPEPEPVPVDTDGDGLLDEDDECVNDPETINGFEDEDGCPDELPKEVEAFSGVVKGILFETGKSEIRPKSFKVLNQAVEIFKKYPSIRVEIQGHTDDRGRESYNQQLSEARAEAVREYLVAQGIDESRISSKGFGPSSPVASNKSKSGRAQNRRIEFQIVQGDEVSAE